MNDQEKGIATAIIDGAAVTASALGNALGQPLVGAGIGALLGVVSKLVGSIGTKEAAEMLEALHARVEAGEGMISDADLATDDAATNRYVDELFKPTTDRGDEPTQR